MSESLILSTEREVCSSGPWPYVTIRFNEFSAGRPRQWRLRIPVPLYDLFPSFDWQHYIDGLEIPPEPLHIHERAVYIRMLDSAIFLARTHEDVMDDQRVHQETPK